MTLGKEIRKLGEQLKELKLPASDVFNIEENKRFMLDFFNHFAIKEIHE